MVYRRSLVITPHTWLAAYVASLSHPLFNSATVLDIETWLTDCWHRVNGSEIVLNPYQARALWKQIISNHPPDHDLSRYHDWIELAESAWKSYYQWNLSSQVWPDTAISDKGVKIFKDWLTHYRAACAAHGWVSICQLPGYLLKMTDRLIRHLPYTIIMLGFHHPWPNLCALMRLLMDQGIEVQWQAYCPPVSASPLTQAKGQPALLPVSSEVEEVELVARWIKGQIHSPVNHRIACVVPDFSMWNKRLESIFSGIVDSDLVGKMIHKPLADYPIIDIAYRLLQLPLQSSWPVHTLHYVLFSPFLRQSTSSCLDQAQRLYQFGAVHLSWKLLKLEGIKLLEKLPIHQNRSPGYWYQKMEEILIAFGWAQQVTLNLSTLQLVKQLKVVLTALKSLHMLMTSCSYKTAIRYLQAAIRDTDFEPTIPYESSCVDRAIQIVDLPHAAILPFEAVWVLGVNQVYYPLTATQAVLLPKAMQSHRNPLANVSVMSHYSKSLFKHVAKSKIQQVYSYARFIKETKQYVYQPLATYPMIAPADIAISCAPDSTLNTPCLIRRCLTDDDAKKNSKPIALLEKDTQTPTVQLLTAQAACAFQAFAKGRLGAQTLNLPNRGLTASVRGQWMHHALAVIWRLLDSQAALLRLSDEAIHQMLTQAVVSSQVSLPKILIKHLPEWMLSLESQRLTALLFQWLALEKKRKSFVVIAREQSLTACLNEQVIRMRVDRVDQLENGACILIDYKSGSPQPLKHWFQEPLISPQLPLYCIAYSHQPVAGIAHAYIRSDYLGFIGVAAGRDDLPHIKTPEQLKSLTHQTSWTAIQANWHTQLAALSSAFCSGQARVAPYNPTHTCLQCGLQLLCRVNHQ